MHGIYIAKIYRPDTIFLLLTVWVYLHLLLHTMLQKKLHGIRCFVVVIQVIRSH